MQEGRLGAMQVGDGPGSGLRAAGVMVWGWDGMEEGRDYRIWLAAWAPWARQQLAGWMEVGVGMGRSVGI